MAAIAQARLIMTGGPSRFDFTYRRMPLAKGEFHLPLELKASNNLGLSILLLWQNKRKIAAELPSDRTLIPILCTEYLAFPIDEMHHAASIAFCTLEIRFQCFREPVLHPHGGIRACEKDCRHPDSLRSFRPRGLT
jgi:hypothetical protein